MSLLRVVAKSLFTAGDLIFPSPKGPRILTYHQVGSELGRQMEVGTDDFRRHLDWLTKEKRVVSLAEAMASWNDQGSEHLVVITFDDGYRDTYTTAFSLLVERSLPFTLYLATQQIESGVSIGPEVGAEPLTWEMIAAMMESGLVTIGAHTHAHRDLRHASETEIEAELSTSDDLIEARVGGRPRHFAYPWGYWAPRADALVRQRYETAVLGGSPRPDPQPLAHRLHRYPIQLSDGFTFFRARLRGGLLLEEKLRRRLKGYAGP